MTALNQFAPGTTVIGTVDGKPVHASVALQIWMRELWLRTGGASGNTTAATAGAAQFLAFGDPEEGPQGMQGPQGPQGPAGQPGPMIWLQADDGGESFVVLNP